MEALKKAEQILENFRTKTCIIYNEDSVPTIKCEIKTEKSAIQDAILCVEQIIAIVPITFIQKEGLFVPCDNSGYWNDVKKHLENLL